MPMTGKPVTLDCVLNDPTILLGLAQLDKMRAVFHQLEEEDFNRSNLHHLQLHRRTFKLDLAVLLQAVEDFEPGFNTANYIFMTDYCGSTMLSRALHCLAQMTTYNEVTVFKELALRRCELDSRPEWRQLWQASLKMASQLLSRSVNEQVSIVKEQPLCNILIPDLITAQNDSRAVLLYSPLQKYLISVLKDSQRREYARIRVNQYQAFDEFQLFGDVVLDELNDAEIAAVHWLYQIRLFERALSACPDGRLKVLNSEHLFADTEAILSDLITFYGYTLTDQSAGVSRLNAMLSKHAKATDVAYSEAKRLADNQASQQQFQSEITQGMDWATDFVSAWPGGFDQARFALT